MKSLHAKEVVGAEKNPIADGAALAHYIVKNEIPLKGLEIDVSSLAPEDLVSSFVNSILHELEQAGRSIDDARSIKWTAKFASESDRLEQLVRYYVDDVLRKNSPARRRAAAAQ